MKTPNEPITYWILACTGCGGPIILGEDHEDGTQDYMTIFPSKELAELASSDMEDEEGEQPNVRQILIKFL